MTNINLGGSSFSQEEVLAAIAASDNDSAVTDALEVINTRLTAIEAKLATLPSSWMFN